MQTAWKYHYAAETVGFSCCRCSGTVDVCRCFRKESCTSYIPQYRCQHQTQRRGPLAILSTLGTNIRTEICTQVPSLGVTKQRNDNNNNATTVWVRGRGREETLVNTGTRVTPFLVAHDHAINIILFVDRGGVPCTQNWTLFTLENSSVLQIHTNGTVASILYNVSDSSVA